MNEPRRFAAGEYAENLLEPLLKGDIDHPVFDFTFRLVIMDMVRVFGWNFKEVPVWFFVEFTQQYLGHLSVLEQKYIVSHVVGRINNVNPPRYDEAPIKSRI